MKTSLATVIALLMTAVFAAAAENTCVSCHRDSVKDSALEHTFADWQKSAHAQAGIECQSCHGGDPSRADKKDAHAGLLSSTDAKSRLYFTNIPATCGSCHAGEFKAFQESLHYKELQRTGRGPNCVTCHGAMANTVIGPREMEQTCALCHRQPTMARSARQAIEDARATLRLFDRQIEKARGAGADVAASRRAYDAQSDRFRGLLVDWHAFDARKVLAGAKALNQEVSASYTELKLKTRKP